MGTFKGPKIKIHVEDNVQPRFYKARVVPFAYRSLVENELDRLVKDEVISPVEFSEWATPVVPISLYFETGREDKNLWKLCSDD